ncbi:MAG: hypothetical protein ABI190_09410 [Casimicrobiaceae bacterium]
MTTIARALPLLLTIVALAVGAQPQPPVPAAKSSAVAPAQAAAPPTERATSPRVTTDGTASVDKSCVAATRKLTREQAALKKAQDASARYDKLQRGCATKTVCERYRSTLEVIDKRIQRHQMRIDRFAASRDKACKT